MDDNCNRCINSILPVGLTWKKVKKIKRNTWIYSMGRNTYFKLTYSYIFWRGFTQNIWTMFISNLILWKYEHKYQNRMRHAPCMDEIKSIKKIEIVNMITCLYKDLCFYCWCWCYYCDTVKLDDLKWWDCFKYIG